VFAREFYRARRSRPGRRTGRDRACSGSARSDGRRETYRAESLSDLDFNRIIDPENLLLVWERLKWEGGPAPGIDELRYDDFTTTEMGEILRFVWQVIRQRRYCPHPTRLVRFLKPDGRRYRELHLPTIIDRIIAKAVAEALTGAFEGILGEHVMGFRPGRGTWTMIAAIEKAMGDSDRWWIAQDDIANCFPTAPIDRVMEAYRQYIADENILDLIERVLRGHDRQRHEVGLDQGNPLSPLSMNVLLHVLLDRPHVADEHHPLPFRYADNLVAVAGSVSEGQDTMRQVHQRLHNTEMDLKNEDGPPVNLCRNGAQIKILGVILTRDNDRIRISLGKDAWKELRQDLDKAHSAPNPVTRAGEIVLGWLGAFAPAFESVDAREVLCRVPQEAARSGFRELPLCSDQLEQCFRRFIEQWRQYRD
jgi:retron-type reverse transcriptase